MQTVSRCAAIPVAEWCRPVSRFEADSRPSGALKRRFLTAGFCLKQCGKGQKQQAPRRAGGLDKLMLKKT